MKGRLIRIKFLVLVNLAVGFVVAIALPRLTIERIDAQGYGLYALIVGFAAALAFSDLGLQPGLVRSLAGPLAKKELIIVKQTVQRVMQLAAGVWIIVSLAITAIISISVNERLGETLHAFAVFSIASMIIISADLAVNLLRVAGSIEYTYFIRIGFSVTFLVLLVFMYEAMPRWPGVWVICYAQLISSVPYAYLAIRRLRKYLGNSGGSNSDPHEVGRTMNGVWSESWRVSHPERINRILQLVAGSIERPILLATSGLLMLGSYDLLVRLAQIVTAAPSALAQPLQAMIAHDQERVESERRFQNAEILGRLIGVILAIFGLIVAVTLWVFFHKSLFSIESQLPAWLAITIMLVTAINVLTATGVASNLGRGETRLINIKMAIEFIGMIIALLVAWIFSSGIAFIAIRNIAIGVSALHFLIGRRCK
jgi:hypothetical protein